MTPRILLRTVRPDDLRALSEVEDACFGPGTRFPPEAIAEMIAATDTSGIVAEFDGRLVGFAFQLLHGNDGAATIITVDVHPGFQRRGIGRSLVRNTLDIAKGLGARRTILQVAIDNDPAVELYKSLGFQKSGVIKDFYGEKKDAWEMERKL